MSELNPGEIYNEGYQAAIEECVRVAEGMRDKEDQLAHERNEMNKHYAVGVLDRLITTLKADK